MLNESMFDRVIMNIIDVTLKVIFITYLMFPKSPLPNANLSFARS